MGEFTRDEIEAAWAEYQKRGVQEHDWPGWADMFTDDARYEEHNLGVFEGKSAIQRFIVDIMKEYPAMTLWIEWSIIDGDRIGFYIWNNLPDPTGTGKRYAFPNTTFLRYGGDGKFSFEADYYNPTDAERVFTEWLTDGGRRDTPQDRSLRGIDGWNPEPPRPACPRAEVEAEFEKYRRARRARGRDRRLGPVGGPVHRRRPLPRAPLRVLPLRGRDPRLDQVGDAAVPDDGVPALVRADRRQPREHADPEHPPRAGG